MRTLKMPVDTESQPRSTSPLAQLEDEKLDALLTERSEASKQMSEGLSRAMIYFHLWYTEDEPSQHRDSLEDALDVFEAARHAHRKADEGIQRRVKQIIRESKCKHCGREGQVPK